MTHLGVRQTQAGDPRRALGSEGLSVLPLLGVPASPGMTDPFWHAGGDHRQDPRRRVPNDALHLGGRPSSTRHTDKGDPTSMSETVSSWSGSLPGLKGTVQGLKVTMRAKSAAAGGERKTWPRP